MRVEYNVYCDESCHLQNDGTNVMALGAIWVPKDKSAKIFERIREIKAANNLAKSFEIKWNKVSNSGIDFYIDIVNYFFDNEDIHYRGLIVLDKEKLDHARFEQDHDGFYYKMYFELLKVIFMPDKAYNVYIDIKDTKSQKKVNLLTEVLRSSKYDYDKKIIKKVQQIDSKEVELLQITDLFAGATAYLHRQLNTNMGKLKLIDLIKNRSGYSLMKSTLYREDKFNLFVWTPKAEENNG